MGGNTMGNGMANGAVVPGAGNSGFGAVAPGYGMNNGNMNGPQAVVPYGGVAPPPGMQWVWALSLCTRDRWCPTMECQWSMCSRDRRDDKLFVSLGLHTIYVRCNLQTI